jgi:hypothetical protein
LEIDLSDAPQFELAQGGDGASRLMELATLATELGSEHVANEASDLAARVAEGRFFVACVGQFKRGKSTLIGALIGESILPTGFVPITAVPTVIRFGSSKGARIRSTNGRWQEIALHELEQYVSEEHNPENVKAVAGPRCLCPARSWRWGCAWWTRPVSDQSSPATPQPRRRSFPISMQRLW